MAMKPAASLESYVSQPIGTYLAGPTYVVWWPHVGLNGISFWGCPDPSDIDRVVRALDAAPPDFSQHRSLVDARRVEAIDAGAFDALASWTKAHRDDISQVVSAQALVRPGGLTGATVAGFYHALTPDYPVGIFTSAESALDWLGLRDDAGVLREIDTIREGVAGICPLIGPLREYLAERLCGAALGDAAAHLRVSPRHLQRKLREANTTFQAELDDARMRVAQGLLLHTNHDVKRIALEVGCGSPQYFSRLFRRRTGSTPCQWRTRRTSRHAE